MNNTRKWLIRISAILIVLFLIFMLGLYVYNSTAPTGSFEQPLLVKFDNENNIIIAGITTNQNFPTINAHDGSYNGADDIYIAKMKSDGTVLWSTFIGGTADEKPQEMVIDKDNNIFISGTTISRDFPTTDNAYQNSKGGSSDNDAILLQFDASGKLKYSSYFGGSWSEYYTQLSLDFENNLLLLLSSPSSDTFTPIDSNLDETDIDTDLFLVKFSNEMSIASVNRLTNADQNSSRTGNIETWVYWKPIQMDVDTEGNIYILQDYDIFTSTENDDGSSSGGGLGSGKIFVKYNADLDVIWKKTIKSTNNGYFYPYDFKLDYDDNIIVEEFNYTNTDIILSKYDADINNIWKLNLGGSNFETIQAIDISTTNQIVILGRTFSSDFTLLNAFDAQFNHTSKEVEDDYYDGFFATIDENGTLLQSSYLGGSEYERFNDIALSEDNMVIVANANPDNFELFPPDTLISNFYQKGSTNLIFVFSQDHSSLSWSTSFGGFDASIQLF